MRKFILRIEYGTGSANMITDTCDLVEAIDKFKQVYGQFLPQGDKSYGMPQIIGAKLEPIFYESIFEEK